MTNPTPPGVSPDVLQDKISSMLEHNGSLSDDERRKLMLYMLQDIRADVKNLIPLGARVKKLEDASVIIQARRHPKIATLAVTLFLFIIMFLEQVGNWIVAHSSILSSIKIP